MPQKNNGASKSFDFHSHFHHSSSPMHQLHQLKLPETDTEMSSQSSTEEIRTASYSSSIKGENFYRESKEKTVDSFFLVLFILFCIKLKPIL
jgi:hypothetical protein